MAQSQGLQVSKKSSRGDDLCSVQHTAEIISVVCNTPLRQIEHHRVKIKISCLVAFKGTVRRNPFRGEYNYHERNLRGVLHNFVGSNHDKYRGRKSRDTLPLIPLIK